MCVSLSLSLSKASTAYSGWAVKADLGEMVSVVTAILTIPFVLLFLFTGLFVNLIQAACFVFIWPLSKNLFRRINDKLVQMMWSELLFFFQWQAGVKVQLYTDPETYKLLGKENALVISNHRYHADWLVIWTLAQQFNCLGRTPAYTQHPFQFIPVFGWALWFSEFIFLKKNFSQDQRKIKTRLQAFKDFPNSFWLSIFVEGMEFSRKTLAAAQKFSISSGLPPPRNVLVPRTKGFVAAVNDIRKFVPAIYDLTIAVSKGDAHPSMSRSSGKPSVVKVHLKRHSMGDLPESEEGIAKWCTDAFVAKDALLDKFIAEGTYGDQIYPSIRPKKSLYVTLFWSFALILSACAIYQKFISSSK